MTEAEQAVINAARAWRSAQRDYDKLNDLLLTTRDQRLEEVLDETGMRLAQAEEALQAAVDTLEG